MHTINIVTLLLIDWSDVLIILQTLFLLGPVMQVLKVLEK